MHEEYLIKIWIFKYFHISQCLHLRLRWHQVVTVQNKQNFVSILSLFMCFCYFTLKLKNTYRFTIIVVLIHREENFHRILYW